MGCACSLSSFVSLFLDAVERISLCTICAMLTCCLLITIVAVLFMGIGIGYQYCYVQNSIEAMEKAAKGGALRSGPGMERQGNVMRSVDEAVPRGFVHRMSRREADLPVASNNNNFTVRNDFTEINNLTDIKTLPLLNLRDATNFTIF